jgi:hypothetical protein
MHLPVSGDIEWKFLGGDSDYWLCFISQKLNLEIIVEIGGCGWKVHFDVCEVHTKPLVVDTFVRNRKSLDLIKDHREVLVLE